MKTFAPMKKNQIPEFALTPAAAHKMESRRSLCWEAEANGSKFSSRRADIGTGTKLHFRWLRNVQAPPATFFLFIEILWTVLHDGQTALRWHSDRLFVLELDDRVVLPGILESGSTTDSKQSEEVDAVYVGTIDNITTKNEPSKCICKCIVI